MIGFKNKNKNSCSHCEVSEKTLKALESREKVYQCSECKTKYKKQKWADKCENWCREHKGRNSDIIKHSIQI